MKVGTVLSTAALATVLAATQVNAQGIYVPCRTARVQSQNIVAGLELFRLDVGRYPTPREGLHALVVAPLTAKGWNGPYLKKESALIDPWGNQYLYVLNGGPHVFTRGCRR